MIAEWQENLRGRQVVELSALFILGCPSIFFDQYIEYYRDHVIFDFFPIVHIFPDSLGPKSRSVETFWCQFLPRKCHVI
jgi:hypothetical protein